MPGDVAYIWDALQSSMLVDKELGTAEGDDPLKPWQKHTKMHPLGIQESKSCP